VRAARPFYCCLGPILLTLCYAVLCCAVQVLLLDNNGFTGKLPVLLSRLSDLEQLDLSANAFTSTLPETWLSLSSVQRITISSNSGISGPIPQSWENFALSTYALRCLDVRGTNVTGLAEYIAAVNAVPGNKVRVQSRLEDVC
jgi:hypothetical protein